MAGSVLVNELPAVGRVTRRPQHPFYIKSRAFAIQPFLLAPVLPGETMKNLLLQARVVTDPVVNPLIGWWQEYYIFYVKHRDLAARDELVKMALDPSWTPDQIDDVSAVTETMHGGGAGSIDWGMKCLQRVTEEYFRDEGVAWDAVKIGNLPVAALSHNSVLDSIINHGDMPDGTVVDEGGSGTVTDQELDAARVQWEFMRANALTNMTYEDFLRTYGVRPKLAEVHRPELIRYLKDWSYPTNTVNPSDGKPTSALSWAIAERADKDRFFSEPGFIFGVSVTRPKVYVKKKRYTAASWMNTPFRWLPAVMKDDPYTSLAHFADESGPVRGTTDADGYWIDFRDLFLYGEAFHNFDMSTETGYNELDLPDAGLPVGNGKMLPSDAMSKSFFVDAAGTKFYVRQDGVVSLSILGRQVDYT